MIPVDLSKKRRLTLSQPPSAGASIVNRPFGFGNLYFAATLLTTGR
jgi:hypothetical protein